VLAVDLLERPVRRRPAAAYVGRVHVVVVDQCAGVQQLQGGTRAQQRDGVDRGVRRGDGVVSPPAERGPEALATPDAGASVLDQSLRVGTEIVQPRGLRVDERLQRGLDVVAEPVGVPLDVPSFVQLGHPASVDPYPQPHV
jgi:hypothetical protein